MTTLDQFSRNDVLRIVGITPKQLRYWERLQLLEGGTDVPDRPSERFYGFGDLIRLRTVKQLVEQRVPASRLRSALEAFRRQWPASEAPPLAELRFVPAGRQVAVEYRGACIEPVSGQLRLDLHNREQESRVRSMPERTLEEWLQLALDCESDPSLRLRAIEAYRNIVVRAPGWLEAKLNLGALYCEDGNWVAAAEQFQRAVEIAPGNPLGHFNLGSVLDDLGQGQQAAQHLEVAVRLAPEFADAHYNLARIYDKSGDVSKARAHWQRYLDLDPSSSWAQYARQRLEELKSELATRP